MELADLDDGSSAVPFGGVRTGLVLYPHLVTHSELGECSGMLAPFVMVGHVTLSQGSLT